MSKVQTRDGSVDNEMKRPTSSLAPDVVASPATGYSQDFWKWEFLHRYGCVSSVEMQLTAMMTTLLLQSDTSRNMWGQQQNINKLCHWRFQCLFVFISCKQSWLTWEDFRCLGSFMLCMAGLSQGGWISGASFAMPLLDHLQMMFKCSFFFDKWFLVCWVGESLKVTLL